MEKEEIVVEEVEEEEEEEEVEEIEEEKEEEKEEEEKGKEETINKTFWMADKGKKESTAGIHQMRLLRHSLYHR